MARLAIWVIDHRADDWQEDGQTIKLWHVSDDEPPGPHYADYCALYNVWASYTAIGMEPELVGFFGYRKYLCLLDEHLTYVELRPAHAPHWYDCDKVYFDSYRGYLAQHDGADFKALLAQHDILQAAPFPLPINLITDFAQSRSAHDADAVRDVLRKHGRSTTSTKIYPYLFITRWSVFDRMMRELELLRLELDPLITAEDSVNEEYKKRPMAYVMERLYSLWLENSGLSIKEVPLLHCWEMS